MPRNADAKNDAARLNSPEFKERIKQNQVGIKDDYWTRRSKRNTS